MEQGDLQKYFSCPTIEKYRYGIITSYHYQGMLNGGQDNTRGTPSIENLN
jgi:hypothetical protein